MKAINEAGKTYGWLKVIEPYDPKKHGEFFSSSGSALWFCECRCGATTIVVGASLRGGLTRSCGCYRLETSAANGRANKGKKRKTRKVSNEE